MCFDFVGTNGVKWKGTVGRSDIDSADLEEDDIGVLPILCFSKVLQDLSAPLVQEKESYASMGPSQEIEASDTVDLAGDWDFLGAGSLWWEMEFLFFRAFPESSEIFPFLGKTLAKVESTLDLSGDRCTEGGLLT